MGIGAECDFQFCVIPLQASSGCPYRCAFCNFVKNRKLTNIKPLNRLVSELKAVSKRGARYVWFIDDNFRLGKHDLNAVCQQLIDEEISVRWMTFIRASALRDVDAQLLRKAGCFEVQLGLESADPQVLVNMNKKATPALYSSVVSKLLSAGINCSCYFIFGFPGETNESVKRTRDFILEHQFPELRGICLGPFFLSF